MAGPRFIKWGDFKIDTKAILQADDQIWSKSVGPLTRCLLAYIDATGGGVGAFEAAEELADDLRRIAAALFPDEARRRQEYEGLQAAWRDRSRLASTKAVPRALRKAVFERDGYRCRLCGSQWELAADHIIPQCQGGPTTLDNLQALCKKCNSRKGGRMDATAADLAGETE